jgi:DMSO/TMAO reductase YedYZ molybdopterin-dependent catalytic subunit
MAGQRLALLCLVLAAGEDPAPGTLQVGDEAGKAAALSAKEWAKLPREKVEVKGLTYEGVSLAEVLRFAGVSFENHPRDRAASYVLVEGGDGYRAVLALAEVDPKVTDRAVLLADRLNGKPLPAGAGPFRLIVPADKVPSRWVKQVTRVGVYRHPDAEAGKKR